MNPSLKIFLEILLNLTGIAIFFLNRFNGREDKTTSLSIDFWMKDNWVELVIICLFDFALMILALAGGLKINFEKIAPALPDWISFTGDLAASFLVGLFGAFALYSLIKIKIEYSKK